MRGPRGWLSVLVPLLALALTWPLIVHAAAHVALPPGWSESSDAATEAQRRAGRWKDALGLRLAQVASSADDDRFAETVAVFERSEPVPEQIFDDPSTAVDALASTVANVVGSQPPKQSGLRTTSGGAQVVWAQWIVDDLAYECVLAPSGEQATVVVMAVLASELDVHEATLGEIVSQLEGVSAPMPRFSLMAWRVGAVLVWLGLGIALHAGMLRLVDRDNDHATAGRRASMINLGLVLVGTATAYLVLGGRELAIIHAGSSLSGLTMWIGVAGLIVAGAHFLLASRLDEGVVQSAPSSGAFASGSYATADVIRSSITRSGVKPRSEDLAEASGSWVRGPQGYHLAGSGDPGTPGELAGSGSGRIIIDEAERE